ncbi:hypothetical protein GCM10023149_49130 [Mucilaginibacter gynuensis]|uniref:DoxX family protein n=1 Tax=Mucilaginibacter gynuensis TaxID=1302236 RepID=A0ABP8HG61_9SPHI
MQNTVTESAYWPLYKKVAFRFSLIFFLAFVVLNPNGVLLDALHVYYIQPVHSLVVWSGAHLLHLPKPITIFTNGSGDTTYDYLIILLISVTAGAGALIWSVLDRRVRNYNNLFYWLLVVVRYYVAISMISYGCVKIIKLQFPGPTPSRLLQSYGDSSPMGLAWTYIGYSTGFNIFTGLAEFICGIFLFFRRTTIMGALLGLVVAGNIMAINYAYDVPVKIVSTVLFVMCLFILSKDAGRLINLLVLNKPALAANMAPHTFKRRWKNITLCVIKYVLVIYIVVSNFYGDWEARSQYGETAKKPPFYGIYNVESFIRNKDTIAPLKTDSTCWHKLIVSYPGYAQVKMTNDSISGYGMTVDTLKHTIKMELYGSNGNVTYFNYTEKKPDLLLLQGNHNNSVLQIKLRKYDLNNFILLRRGFHWVNEYPYNR